MSTPRTSPTGLGERLFRLALRALPADFRAAYGAEIQAFQQERIRDGGQEELCGGQSWAMPIWDVLKGAVLEWGRSFAVALKRSEGSRYQHHDPDGSKGPAGGPPRPGPGLWLDLLWQDIRIGSRGLARTQGFTFVAVFSLAVGTGVSIAMFSLFNETWLEPVPGVLGSDRAVELVTTRPGTGLGDMEVMSYPDFVDLREADTPLSDVAGWRTRAGTLTAADGGEPVQIMYVSANYFQALGVSPRLGRGFTPAEDVGPGQHSVAVVSHAMWQDRLGGVEDIVGSTLTLNRTPYTVVGVAPPEFLGHRTLTEPTEVWLPLMQDPWVSGSDGWTEDRDALWLRALGRLGDGATLGEANAAIQTVFSRLEELYPESNEDRSAQAFSFGPIPARGRAETLVAVTAVAVLIGLVLLIICGNVAGMVLARSVAREQEIAVRMALGSGRGRLARLLLMEALILAVAGCGFGLLVGVWGMEAAYKFLPDAPMLSFSFEGPVVAFALVLSGFSTLAVGILPAVRFSRPELVSYLKDDNGGGGRRAGRVHRFSASAQTGVALILLGMCGLFLRALDVVGESDLGFEPSGLFTARVDLFQEGYESLETAEPFLRRVRENLSSVPGVVSTTVADGIPLDLSGNFTGVSRADSPEETEGRIQVEFTTVTEHFFETIGTTVLRGRGIEVGDDQNSEPVIVITESLAATMWPGEEALGRRVRSGIGREGPGEFTVVGVIADVASSRATENWPNVFFALRQNYRPRILIVVSAAADLAAMARPIQSAILDADPNLLFPVLVASETLVRRSTQSQRMSAGMAGALGLLALLLSAVGVYGVVAFAVTSRTREIGLRMAMGATRGEVLRGVLRGAVRLAIPGLGVGLLGAVGMAVAFQSEFFGLNPVDPVALGGSACALFVVVLLASLVPARRASGIDPMEALRGE